MNGKKTNVIPLFKKDDRQNKVNYCPMSLLPSLSKLLERVVLIQLYNYLIEVNYLNPLQSLINCFLLFIPFIQRWRSERKSVWFSLISVKPLTVFGIVV